MRERLKNYLEERLSDSSTEYIGLMQQDRRDAEWKRRDAGEKLKMTKSQLKASKTQAPTEKKQQGDKDIVSEWNKWQAIVDNKRGMVYYYNKKTSQSQWDKPTGFPEFKLSASKRVALEEQNKRYTEWHKDAAKVNVLGKGTMVISDENFDDGSSTKSTKSTPVGETNSELPPEGVVDGTQNPPTLPIVQQGEWSAYYDIKSGLVFYFNEKNGETTWDPPFRDFPRIIMENNFPKVLESGNISMERALGYIGVDEMAEAAEAAAWEEAKKKERERKAAMRAQKAKEAEKDEAAAVTVDMYESAKKAELERLEKLAEEQQAKDEAAKLEAAAKLEEQEKLQQAWAEDSKIAKEREAAAKLAEEERLEIERVAAAKAAKRAEEERLEGERITAAKLAKEERMEQERIAFDEATKLAEEERIEQKRVAAEAAKMSKEQKLEQERIAAEVAKAEEKEASAKALIEEQLEQDRLKKEKVDTNLKQPVLPKEDPVFTAKNVETLVAPLKTKTLYESLQISPTATRAEIKKSYLNLAKVTHPDALLQIGMVNNDETEQRFVEISQAWKVLGDTQSRRRYDRELQAKGISSKAGSLFENWVMGAAKAMDKALEKAETGLENEGEQKP